MAIPGDLLTTAMAVMPHKDVDRALDVALSLDVPFWPQLPHVNYYEDMYVQASENFPGILLDLEKRTLRFSMDKFVAEFEETMAHFGEPDYFDIPEQQATLDACRKRVGNWVEEFLAEQEYSGTSVHSTAQRTAMPRT